MTKQPLGNDPRRQNQEIKDSKDFIEAQGEVIELMPAGLFKIRLENGQEILGHLSGKMRMFKIRLLPGDQVKVEMSPYDLSKGRITYRM
jgi:translation initiation factor IF-1